MSDQNGSIRANVVGTPPSKNRVNKEKGRVRIFESTITIPAANRPAVGEFIRWGQLPKGANVLGNLSEMNFSAGGGSLTLGDATDSAKHLAATSVASAGTATPNAAQADGASVMTTDDSGGATDDCDLVSEVSGATLTAGQVITLRMFYTLD